MGCGIRFRRGDHFADFCVWFSSYADLKCRHFSFDQARLRIFLRENFFLSVEWLWCCMYIFGKQKFRKKGIQKLLRCPVGINCSLACRSGIWALLSLKSWNRNNLRRLRELFFLRGGGGRGQGTVLDGRFLQDHNNSFFFAIPVIEANKKLACSVSYSPFFKIRIKKKLFIWWRARRFYVYRCQFGDVVNPRQSIKNVLNCFHRIVIEEHNWFWMWILL